MIDVKEGNCYKQVDAALKLAKKSDKPTLVVTHTAIGYGSPKQGMSAAHGEPLGEENIAITKKNLGWPCEEPFGVPEEVYEITAKAQEKGKKAQAEWEKLFAEGAVREMILQPFVRQRAVENIWEEKTYTEYIAGTILMLDDSYYGTGLFRSSSLPVLNKLDDRKVGYLRVEDTASYKGRFLVL